MSIKAIDILHATIGPVSSREDGSVAFRVITPELRPSEKGEIMSFHGRAVRVLITPDDAQAPETVTVDTEMGGKTPGQRLRNIVYAHYQQLKERGETTIPTFEQFYTIQMSLICDGYKQKNLTPE